jgi:hypothetical protein
MANGATAAGWTGHPRLFSPSVQLEAAPVALTKIRALRDAPRVSR